MLYGGKWNMSVYKKNKRKLVYEDKVYYWSVSQDFDRGELRENFNILHIISDDKSLEYHIPLELYFNPIPKAITPSFVKDIVERSLKVTKDNN